MRSASKLLVLLCSLVAVCHSYDPTAAYSLAVLCDVAYCDENAIISWTCKVCKPDFKLVKFLYDKSSQLAGFIATATVPEPRVFVVIRGSDNLENWILNLNATESPTRVFPNCTGCIVHSGFYGGYLSLRAAILSTLGAYSKRMPIVCTGHSLGGAVAALAAYDLSSIGYNVTTLYTFGKPRVGNTMWDAAMTKMPFAGNDWRVVNNADVVPHLPPAAIFKLSHSGTEVWYHTTTYKVCAANVEDPTCSDSLSAWSYSITDHTHYMGFRMGACGATSPANAELADAPRETGRPPADQVNASLPHPREGPKKATA